MRDLDRGNIGKILTSVRAKFYRVLKAGILNRMPYRNYMGRLGEIGGIYAF